MQLNNDELFKLWRDKKMYVEDVLSKSKNPDELARRIVEYKRRLVEGKSGDDDNGHGR